MQTPRKTRWKIVEIIIYIFGIILFIYFLFFKCIGKMQCNLHFFDFQNQFQLNCEEKRKKREEKKGNMNKKID